MGLKRIIIERDFGSIPRHAANHLRLWWRTVEEYCRERLGYLRGWTERDIEALEKALNDPKHYDGGIVKLTRLQFRALEERNRRVTQNKRNPKISPLLVWVKGRGLFPAIKKD
jgi:hypothetical protein